MYNSAMQKENERKAQEKEATKNGMSSQSIIREAITSLVTGDDNQEIVMDSTCDPEFILWKN